MNGRRWLWCMDSKTVQAVIDLGSHSALLLVGALDSGDRLRPLVQEFAVTRLAEDLPLTGRIGAAAQERLCRVLQRYAGIIKEQGAVRVGVVATEAMRRAQNSTDIAALIQTRFGWPVHVLSAEEEARYAYRGALTEMAEADQKLLIVDVGGGSTELITGQGRNIADVASLPVGALNLAQKMRMQRHLCSSERLGLMQYLKLLFMEIPFWETLDAQSFLIGSGGTATALAALQLKLKTYDGQRVNSCALSRRQLWFWFFKLNDLSPEQRRLLAGMEAGREDVILYGTLIFLTLMELRRLEVLHIRQGGVRYGYLQEMLTKRQNA